MVRGVHPPLAAVAGAEELPALGVVELEDAQSPVRMATKMKARHRLLARVAALGKRDMRPVEACLRGQDAAVELALPPRNAALDPAQLALLPRHGLP